MFFQTDPFFGTYMNRYSCLFMVIAYARELYTPFRWTREGLKERWVEAIGNGTGIGESIITGDLNKDGDMDDKGELEIRSHTALAILLESPIRMIPPPGKEHFPATQPILKQQYAAGCFYNPFTHFHHFGAIDYKKRVIYDPIENGSITIRDGYLETIRMYEVLV